MPTEPKYPGWHVLTIDGQLVGGFLEVEVAREVAKCRRMFYHLTKHPEPATPAVKEQDGT